MTETEWVGQTLHVTVAVVIKLIEGRLAGTVVVRAVTDLALVGVGGSRRVVDAAALEGAIGSLGSVCAAAGVAHCIRQGTGAAAGIASLVVHGAVAVVVDVVADLGGVGIHGVHAVITIRVEV